MSLILRSFFVASTVLLALLGLAAPTIESGTDTFVISVLSGGMLAVVFTGSAACLYLDWDPFEQLLT